MLYRRLALWKESSNRKPLILNGARQVGKTWLLKEFAENEYDNFIYVNCDENEDARRIFEKDYDVSRIIRDLSAIAEVKAVPSRTLIMLDEIQEIPKAISALKYFCEDKREYHVAAAGSLLGLKVHSGTGFPVGKVDMLNLHPLSFMEFLRAMGKTEMSDLISARSWEEMNSLSGVLTDALRQYYFVGGMPEAVKEYSQSNDIFKVREIQKSILNGYEFDFSKHIPSDLLPKVQMVWNSIPSQLAKENKKFIYSAVKKGSRAKDFENAIRWLVDAGLIHLVSRIRKIEKPLKFFEDFGCFKIFVNDLGLLGVMSGANVKDLLVSDEAFKMYKGSLTEQFVFQQHLSASQDKPIFYYSNEDSTSEIDFVFQFDDIYSAEVKAEINLRSKSLSVALKSNPELQAIRFSMAGYKEQDRLVNVPLYLAEEYIRMLDGRGM